MPDFSGRLDFRACAAPGLPARLSFKPPRRIERFHSMQKTLLTYVKPHVQEDPLSMILGIGYLGAMMERHKLPSDLENWCAPEPAPYQPTEPAGDEPGDGDGGLLVRRVISRENKWQKARSW